MTLPSYITVQLLPKTYGCVCYSLLPTSALHTRTYLLTDSQGRVTTMSTCHDKPVGSGVFRGGGPCAWAPLSTDHNFSRWYFWPFY